MKKTLPIILALTMVCGSFTACGDKDKNGDENATDNIAATDESRAESEAETESETHDNGVLGDVVTDAEKQRRNQVLLADQDVRAMRINNQLIGTTTEVLVEGPSLRNQEKWSGRNSQNKIVIFEPKTEVAIGDFVNVRITSVQPQTLYGEVVE